MLKNLSLLFLLIYSSSAFALSLRFPFYDYSKLWMDFASFVLIITFLVKLVIGVPFDKVGALKLHFIFTILTVAATYYYHQYTEKMIIQAYRIEEYKMGQEYQERVILNSFKHKELK